MLSSYSDDSTVVSHRRDAGEQRGSTVHRPGINYFRRIRCVTVGTAQITRRLPTLLNSALLLLAGRFQMIPPSTIA
jgi:hypothetical protein